MTSAATDAAPAAAEAPRRADLVWLAVVAVVVRLPAVLSSRHLSFDDGVYGATADAMRDGARPYRDVFSSQGPLHQPLLFVADLVGARTANAPRLLPLVAGVVITCCTYLIATRLAGRRAGLVAAGLATTAGSLLLVTTGISGDGPAIAFAVAAVAAAFAYRDRPRTVTALGAGLLAGAALSIKFLVAPVVVPVALLLCTHRRRRDVAVAAAAAAALPLLLALPWGYDLVWDQSVRYHREPRRYGYAETAHRMLRALVERDTFVVTTAVVAGAAAWIGRPRRPGPSPASPSGGPGGPRPAVVLATWLGAQVAILLFESAMWRPHVSQLVVPLCLLAALRLPSWRVMLVAWLVAAPVYVVGVHDIARPGGYRGLDARVAEHLRRLPDGAIVVTDEPGFAWRAGRRVPDEFVDASVKQFDQGRITERDVVRAARRPATCAVLITSGERLGRYTDLPARLARDGYRTGLAASDRRLLLRDCPSA